MTQTPEKVPALKNSKLFFIANRASRSLGFTLIEILIVLGIIAAIMAFSFSRIRKNENNIRSVARNLIVMSKEIRNHARLTNSTMRLVIQIDPNNPKYWVEKSSGHEIRDANSKEEIADTTSSEDTPKTTFQLFKTLTKKQKELPKGLFFNSVEVINQDIVSDGYGFIYFTPEGFVDAAALQITDKKNTWTLIFNPLSGQADFLPEAKSLKDISR